MSFTDKTVRIDAEEKTNQDVSEILDAVYHALEEKGYNPINQIVGYLLTEDPAYIPRSHNARQLIRQFERDEIMEVLVRDYLYHHGTKL